MSPQPSGNAPANKLPNTESAADKEIKGAVVDFAISKTIGESAVKTRNYSEAAKSYEKSIELMEQLLAKLPAEQAAPIRVQLEATRAKMHAELAGAAAATNSST
eukprot:m.557890 g.557890  ORF g.557890 m.557890 type:complete len:104 (-) comp22192_c1_seq2:3023-3334(-)